MTKRPKGSDCLYLRGKTWWIKYSDPNRRARPESAEPTKRSEAQSLLKRRLGKCEDGTLEEPQIKRIQIDVLAEDPLRDYRINGKRSIEGAEIRWGKHLQLFFGGMKVVHISSQLLARYVDDRCGLRAA